MATISPFSTYNKLKPFNKLKPMLQQCNTKPNFVTYAHVKRSLPKLSMDLQQSVRNQTHVATTLATHLLSKKYPESNVVFSPLSIHTVLSVLAAGSKCQTLDQLLTFLKTNNVDELNYLSSQLVSSVLADGSPLGGPCLSFANGLWADKTVSLKPSFQQVVDTVYNATCNQVDLTKVNEVANEVNSWAEKKTHGLIKQVINAETIKELTWLIFVNAVYFKGAWLEKFKPHRTEEYDFHLLNGKKVQVPFMTSTDDQLVCEYDDFKILGLPYLHGQDKRQFTMYFLLPHAKDGLQSLVQKVGSTPDFLSRHIPSRKVEVNEFLIPKFKMSFGFEASDMLKELGLDLPFSLNDGMTEMVNSTRGDNVYVSSIYHKSFVEVNEEGTKAAAVSTLLIPSGSSQKIMHDKVDFVADHPFLFVIREDVTGALLFIGQVIDPTVT